MNETRSDRITALYRDVAGKLFHIVRYKLAGAHDDMLIEDACSFAWAQLVRRADVDPDHPDVFEWLVTVATREAWTLVKRQTATPEAEAQTFAEDNIDDALAAREALRFVDELPARQRQMIALAASGLSREEIAASLNTTVRTVDRQIARARRRLRDRADPA